MLIEVLMNSSKQNKSANDTVYDVNVELESFKLFGKTESVKQGEKLFVQGQKAGFFSFLQNDKTYLLLEGSVTIEMASGQIVNIEQGEVLGEYTPYATSNATATANTACKLLSLNEKQLLATLKKRPEFLCMLVDVLFKYLQKPDTQTQDALLLVESERLKHNGVIDSDMIEQLKKKLGDDALMVVPEKRVVFREGGGALLMYLILEGNMVIVIDNKIVGRSSSGDVVGQIALIAPGYARIASVVAETRCSLLAMDRQTLFKLIQTLPDFGITLLKVSVVHLYACQAMR